jgi:enoyl-CoA hydratase/carnithine racemase
MNHRRVNSLSGNLLTDISAAFDDFEQCEVRVVGFRALIGAHVFSAGHGNL